MEKLFLALFDPQPTDPGCGLTLVCSSPFMIAGYYTASVWLTNGAFPLLENGLYTHELLLTFLKGFILFAVPLMSLFMSWIAVSRILHIVPIRSPKIRTLFHLYGIVPFLCASMLLLVFVLFIFPDEMRVASTYDRYTVAMTQKYRADPRPEVVLFLEVIRSDGDSRSELLFQNVNPLQGDKKDTICRDLRIYRAFSRIYFLCDNEQISKKTSYIDKARGVVYIGWNKCNSEVDIEQAFAVREGSLCGD